MRSRSRSRSLPPHALCPRRCGHAMAAAADSGSPPPSLPPPSLSSLVAESPVGLLLCAGSVFFFFFRHFCRGGGGVGGLFWGVGDCGTLRCWARTWPWPRFVVHGGCLGFRVLVWVSSGDEIPFILRGLSSPFAIRRVRRFCVVRAFLGDNMWMVMLARVRWSKSPVIFFFGS